MAEQGVNQRLNQGVNEYLLLVPFALFLFILPFPGTVALRLLCLAFAFVIAIWRWRRLAPPPMPCKTVLIVWAAVALAAVPYSFDPGYSLGEVKNEIGYAMMVFAAFFAVTRGARELRVFAVALGMAALVIALWGGYATWRAGDWPQDGGHGGSGVASSFVVTVFPLFGLAALAVTRRGERIGIAMALLALVAIGLAGRQRIVWPVLGLEAIAGVLLLWRAGIAMPSRRIALASLAGAALIAVVGLAAIQESRLSDRLTRPFAEDSRIAQWPRIMKRIIEAPLAGGGFGRQVMRKVYPELIPGNDADLWHAHNVFLNYGLSAGLPGMAAIAAVFIALLMAHLRVAGGASGGPSLLGIAGVLMILGVVARNSVNDFFVRDGALLFWAVNGALLGAGLRRVRAARAAGPAA